MKIRRYLIYIFTAAIIFFQPLAYAKNYQVVVVKVPLGDSEFLVPKLKKVASVNGLTPLTRDSFYHMSLLVMHVREEYVDAFVKTMREKVDQIFPPGMELQQIEGFEDIYDSKLSFKQLRVFSNKLVAEFETKNWLFRIRQKIATIVSNFVEQLCPGSKPEISRDKKYFYWKNMSGQVILILREDFTAHVILSTQKFSGVPIQPKKEQIPKLAIIPRKVGRLKQLFSIEKTRTTLNEYQIQGILGIS